MKKNVLLACCLSVVFAAHSQKSAFDYRFYGFVRGDLYCNSRSNAESVDGLFYLYPNDILPDADGKDLNATPNSGFYTLSTRLGLDIKGPDIGKAKTHSKIETDFGGTTNMNFMLRIRQAYLRLDWDGGSSLTLGQTWHPLFGEVSPSMLNLSTGAPFQPFNRSPQLKYQYSDRHLCLTASAIYQLIYKTQGMNGKSEEYLKNGVVPEIYIGADYKSPNLIIGAGADMISIKPRLQSVVGNNIYKVDERITSLSYDMHARYVQDKLTISGKTLLASNLTHATMLGGFGATSENLRTGERQYSPFRHSTSWLNIVYGRQYQGSLFAGYSKNLGMGKQLADADAVYGTGVNIDQLFTLNFCLRYILPHWNIGIEYTYSTADYGDIAIANGKVQNTHSVTNHRLESVFIYTF